MKMADCCQFVGITGFLYLVRGIFFTGEHPNYCAEYEESNAFYCKFIVERCVFFFVGKTFEKILILNASVTKIIYN